MQYLSVYLLTANLIYVKSAEITCSSFGNCAECIGFADEKCVWCSQPDLKEKRCQNEVYFKKDKSWCTTEYLTKRKPGIVSGELNKGTKKFQIHPQLLNITTLPGDTLNFNISFKPEKDFPLDVYYLMDHSYTMSGLKDTLKREGGRLYSQLRAFTNNVQFGVGTFVEKPSLPYADPDLNRAYSFKNHLSMTDNIKKFEDLLSSRLFSEFGSNYDDPEAGLYGLMEAMTCEKELGWRKDARRIIVLCTDNTYHSAGDGKIVGAFQPHDMKCHLHKNNSDLIFDYPSVSQINRIATKENFLIIFAAVRKVREEYTALAKAIHGAKYAELDEKDKSNIVEIIQTVYLDSVSYLKLDVVIDKEPSSVQVKLEPDCTQQDVCKIVHNTTLKIKGSLTAKVCLRTKSVPVVIRPVGLSEHLTINLQVDCKCDCETKGKINSTICSSSGTYQCGVCRCNSGSYGDVCQCSGNSKLSIDLEKCKANVKETLFCSGRGHCKCGKCDSCDPGFTGEFCEISENDCIRNGVKCSGRGKCLHGKCVCSDHWTGDVCECPGHHLDCIAPYSKEVCSGKGKCDCGVCYCNWQSAKNQTYGGTFCDVCDGCAEKRCKELEDYVYCNYMNNKTFCDHTFNVSNSEVLMVNKTEIRLSKYIGEWCSKTLDNGTAIIFKHHYDKTSKKLKFVIQKEFEVPPEGNIWVAVGSAIGVVLLIGLLTVIGWKILVDWHDKKEYEKFAFQAKEAGFEVSENPWYRPPAHNFSNPTFNN